jgi:hypothetical protein
MIKRYTDVAWTDLEKEAGVSSSMVECFEGDYVLFTDYEAELTKANERIKEEERQHGNTIDSRDEAIRVIEDMYKLVIGETPEWSNQFNYVEAINMMAEALEVK